MRIIALFLASIMITACSVAPQTLSRSASLNAATTRVDPRKKFLTKWELDLLLNLWFHLVSEESRIKREIRNSNNSEDVKTLKSMLVVVRGQSDETWRLLFSGSH